MRLLYYCLSETERPLTTHNQPPPCFHRPQQPAMSVFHHPPPKISFDERDIEHNPCSTKTKSLPPAHLRIYVRASHPRLPHPPYANSLTFSTLAGAGCDCECCA